jgi:hypothetical protein
VVFGIYFVVPYFEVFEEHNKAFEEHNKALIEMVEWVKTRIKNHCYDKRAQKC